METGESTGKDVNNGGNTLYVAVTGTDEVLAVDLSSKKQLFAYQYVGAETGNAAPPTSTRRITSPSTARATWRLPRIRVVLLRPR